MYLVRSDQGFSHKQTNEGLELCGSQWVRLLRLYSTLEICDDVFNYFLFQHWTSTKFHLNITIIFFWGVGSTPAISKLESVPDSVSSYLKWRLLKLPVTATASKPQTDGGDSQMVGWRKWPLSPSGLCKGGSSQQFPNDPGDTECMAQHNSSSFNGHFLKCLNLHCRDMLQIFNFFFVLFPSSVK